MREGMVNSFAFQQSCQIINGNLYSQNNCQELYFLTFYVKVVLIVNVATYWGLTSQYHQLNELQDSYSNLTVLAFPCNQFAKVDGSFNLVSVHLIILYIHVSMCVWVGVHSPVYRGVPWVPMVVHSFLCHWPTFNQWQALSSGYLVSMRQEQRTLL